MSDTSKEEVDLALLEKLLAEGHRHSDGSPCPRCQGPDALWRAALAPAKDAGGQPSVVAEGQPARAVQHCAICNVKFNPRTDDERDSFAYRHVACGQPAPASPTQGRPAAESAPSPETAMREALDAEWNAAIEAAAGYFDKKADEEEATLAKIGPRFVAWLSSQAERDSYETKRARLIWRTFAADIRKKKRAALSPPAAQPETATALGVCDLHPWAHLKHAICVNWRALSSAPGGEK